MTELDTIRIAAGVQNEDTLYIRPHLANKKMRAAQTLMQTVYVYGISGCGKTSFMEMREKPRRSGRG